MSGKENHESRLKKEAARKRKEVAKMEEELRKLTEEKERVDKFNAAMLQFLEKHGEK